MTDDFQVPPYWSKENIWEAAADGTIQSKDLTPDFKLNLKDPLSKTTRFGMQEVPFPPGHRPRSNPTPSKAPKESKERPRPPLAPLVVRSGEDDNYGVIDVTRRTMGIEIAGQEGVIAEQDQIITGQEVAIEAMRAKLAYLEKHVDLQANVIGSFCAYFQHQNADKF